MSNDQPAEVEKLLAVRPDEFVDERQRLARELRDAGRSDEAATVAQLRKPSPVVLAVNRAARARPKAARAAADAALRVKKTQVGGDPAVFRETLAELEDSLKLLADVALAHVAPSGKRPTEAMRRRVRDLLRNAAADDADAGGSGSRSPHRRDGDDWLCAACRDGQSTRAGKTQCGPTSRTKPQDEKRRERERALRDELARAEQDLDEATRSAQAAERRRKNAEQAVASIRARLERL